jgi:hypothetical protein
VGGMKVENTGGPLGISCWLAVPER